MSEINQLSPHETSSVNEHESKNQEVSSVDSTDIPTEANEPAPATNESIPANDDQPEQQVVDGNDTTDGVKPVQEADGDEEAQQYERFESQMLFNVDTPEGNNEELLTELVNNRSNINRLDSNEVDRYISAIKSTFSSNMIQGLASRSARFKRMLLVGDACNVLKPIVKSSGQGWEDYIEDHLGKELLSTIGTYMRLAIIKGVEQHSYLGKDRILKVFSMRKKINNLPSKSSDPIGDILHKLKIDPINSIFDDVPMFNKRVDAALFAHKIKINGIKVSQKSVIDLASTRFNFKSSNKHLDAMLKMKDNSGDPKGTCQKYLNNILENNGIYNGSAVINESGKSDGKEDFLDTLKESYGSIRTSFSKGKELSTEERSEITNLVDYLTKLIA